MNPNCDTATTLRRIVVAHIAYALSSRGLPAAQLFIDRVSEILANATMLEDVTNA
jgi:hypothetical protein